MLKIEFIFEDETVVFTKHGDERRVMRDGQMVGVSRDRIENIIHNNFKRIKPFWGRFNKFIFRNQKDGLNVVGELVRDGDDWTFKVVTVMFKHNYKPYFGDYVVNVNESKNLMMFESFMEAEDRIMEIASDEGGVFDYEQVEAGDEEGMFSWVIKITDGSRIDDEMVLNIEYVKDPSTKPEMVKWFEKFEDVIECLGMIDGNNTKQIKSLRENLDAKKWSSLIDIAEVEMMSKKWNYEITGYGKAVALKLLRTRFKIIKGWVDAYKPDVFLSKPKKEEQKDNRRLRIYELYFKKYLSGYSVFTKDMTNARPWFSSDILVCLNERINDRIISSIEEDVERAIY